MKIAAGKQKASDKEQTKTGSLADSLRERMKEGKEKGEKTIEWQGKKFSITRTEKEDKKDNGK